jgi:hypothetical protein
MVAEKLFIICRALRCKMGESVHVPDTVKYKPFEIS